MVRDEAEIQAAYRRVRAVEDKAFNDDFVGGVLAALSWVVGDNDTDPSVMD